MGLGKNKIDELLKVYRDLERTLKSLRATYDKAHDLPLRQIDLKKLIHQLSLSKKRIERKIGNTLLLEKEELTRQIKLLVSQRTSGAKGKTNPPERLPRA